MNIDFPEKLAIFGFTCAMFGFALVFIGAVLRIFMGFVK